MMNKGTLSIRLAILADARQLYLWDEKPHVRLATSHSGSLSFDAEWEKELGDRSDGTEFL